MLCSLSLVLSLIKLFKKINKSLITIGKKIKLFTLICRDLFILAPFYFYSFICCHANIYLSFPKHTGLLGVPQMLQIVPHFSALSAIPLCLETLVMKIEDNVSLGRDTRPLQTRSSAGSEDTVLQCLPLCSTQFNEFESHKKSWAFGQVQNVMLPGRFLGE